MVLGIRENTEGGSNGRKLAEISCKKYFENYPADHRYQHDDFWINESLPGGPSSGERRAGSPWVHESGTERKTGGILGRSYAAGPAVYFLAKDFVRGDMGISLLYRQPVTEVIGVKLSNSLFLMSAAWVISGILGLFLGVVAGMNRGKLIDKAIQGYCLVISSTPAFWLALLLLLVFGVWLRLFPIGLSLPIGVEASGVTLADRIYHAILPALTLSITGVSNITLHTREKMADIMESDYVLFARMRGEKGWRLFKYYGFRNVLLPAITLQFASISEIFGGSVIVEQVFSYPGLGQAAVAAGLGSDMPLLMAITIVSALFVFGGNLAANILYGLIDPRIRRGGKVK